MKANEKREKIIRILEEEACEMCECSCGDRYSDMTQLDADTDMERIKKVADEIIALFQEETNQ